MIALMKNPAAIDLDLETIITGLEKEMVTLPPDVDHVAYLAGYIDSLSDSGVISEEYHDFLYRRYVRAIPES